jgi:hypothetical protein
MSTTQTHPCLVDSATGYLVGCGAARTEGKIIGWNSSGAVYVQPWGFVGSPTAYSAESLGLRIGETL